jgi:hypothetical protein
MRHLLASLVPVLLPPLLLANALLSAPAIAADGDRQAPDAADAKGAPSDARPVPWLVPNLQIQSWLTVWDQDESAQADAGGYGDPELDTGFSLRRARLGFSGGFKQVDFSLRFGSSFPYDALTAKPAPVDVIDAWARGSFKSAAGVTRISVGQQRVPFSREQQISSNDLTFQDVAVSTHWLTPNRSLGAMVTHDFKALSVAAGVYNGDGTLAGNADNGVMAVGHVDVHMGGDTYRTNATDSAFGIGGSYAYNHQVSTETHMVEADLIGRYKGLSLIGEFDLNLVRPNFEDAVLPPDVPVQTQRMGAYGQLSYYRDVGLGAIEPAVRFSWLDDATHLKDNGDVAILDAGFDWREPIPFLDLGAGYIHRMELQGTDTRNDSVRVWVGVKYPSRRFEPFDLVQVLRGLGAKPLSDDPVPNATPAGGKKQHKPRT